MIQIVEISVVEPHLELSYIHGYIKASFLMSF